LIAVLAMAAIIVYMCISSEKKLKKEYSFNSKELKKELSHKN